MHHVARMATRQGREGEGQVKGYLHTMTHTKLPSLINALFALSRMLHNMIKSLWLKSQGRFSVRVDHR